MLCRDIELACDERVIKDLGQACKKPYLQALINCSAPRKMISACPLAFGEVGVERRIKNVLHYRKPAFRVLVAATLICIIAAVCLLTNPFDKSGGKVVMDGYEVDCIEYICRESPDIFKPRIKLFMEEKNGTFSFTFSALSSFWPHGTFEMTDTELILKTDAPVHTYTFRKDGANYIFDAEKSSLMPQYYYGLDKGNAKPVEDGAVFEPLAVHFSEKSDSGYSAVIDSMMADIDKDGE